MEHLPPGKPGLCLLCWVWMCQPGLELLLEARDGEDRLVTPQSEHLKVGRRLVGGEGTREQLVSAEAAVGERRQF